MTAQVWRSTRPALAWVLGIAGLLAYNWWLLVPLKPGLMSSPDELFSNLEVTGRPYAITMQHLDLTAGLLLMAAFAVLWPTTKATRRECLAMIAWAAAGTLGGLFPEVCADGISRTCRDQEWRFQLPVTQYVHVLAGIAEFTAITVALWLALRRTRRHRTRFSRMYLGLAMGAVLAYPLLGLAYLTDTFGGVMEAVFFTGFTIMALTQIADLSRVDQPDRQSSPAQARTVQHGTGRARQRA